MTGSVQSPDPTTPPGRTEPGPIGPWRRLGSLLKRGGAGLGDVFVVLALLAMVALPVVSSLWRRFTGESIPSATVLVQHLTLWVGFLGALLAARYGKHLHLTTLDLFPDGRARQAVEVFTGWVAAAVTAVLAYASARLVHVESESRMVVGGIPFWWSMSVMPVTLAAMSLVFAWRAPPVRRRGLLRLAGLSVVFLTFLWSEASLPDPGSWPLDALGAPGRGFAATAAGLGKVLGPLASPGAIVWTFGSAVALAFLLGAPVFVGMAGLAMVLFVKDMTPVAAVPTQTFTLVSSPTLAAIPLLTVAGYVLAEGGAAQRLVRAYRGLFGWMPGGLAIMAVAVAALFTTFTGASGVTILALGGLLLPALLDDGYPEGFSVGLVTAAGSLGLLFPPSLPVILYGVVAGTAIEDLFIGGLVPGILMIVLVAAYGVWMGVRCKAPRQKFQPVEALRSLWEAKWDLGLPTLVVVVVLSGFATIVEASAIAAAYALFVELAIFRDLKPFVEAPRRPARRRHAGGQRPHPPRGGAGAHQLVRRRRDPHPARGLDDHPREEPGALPAHAERGAARAGERARDLLGHRGGGAAGGAARAWPTASTRSTWAWSSWPTSSWASCCPPMGLNLFLSAQRFGKPLPFVYKQAFPFLVIMSVGVLLVTYLEPITTGVVRLVKG